MGIVIGARARSNVQVSKSGRRKSWTLWGLVLLFVVIGQAVLTNITASKVTVTGGHSKRQRRRFKVKRYETAVTILERLLLTEPFNRDATLMLAQSLLGLRHVDRALKLLNEAIAMRPTDAGALYMRGRNRRVSRPRCRRLARFCQAAPKRAE